jgi:hypothetical protein
LSLIVAFTAVILLGCGGGDPTSDSTTQSAAASANHWACPNGSGYKMYPAQETARIVPDPEPISGTFLQYPVNQWRVGTHRLVTSVTAGAESGRSTTGLLAITRDSPCDPHYARTHNDLIRVAGAGPLKITDAPLGPRALGSAQRRANIEFTGRSGITGTLRLSDDSVTVKR